MLEFPDSFFQGETIDGFFVEETMKQAWAAGMEVLEEVKRICDKYNIRYFATLGTLLGAVRHKGFIPWDDDIDISMLRADYIKFKQHTDELPKGYFIYDYHSVPESGNMLTRVVNSSGPSTKASFLQKYHGCPFAVGIDIFPIDYIPGNLPEEYQIYRELSQASYLCGMQLAKGDVSESEIERIRKNIYELFHVELPPIPKAENLFELTDLLFSSYSAEECDFIGQGAIQYQSPGKYFSKHIYDSVIEMPFEMITVPAPIGYDEELTKTYGDYMTPVICYGHDYPFYKEQEELLEKAIVRQKSLLQDEPTA